MKNYISESRAVYEDNYHGQFSKKLAEWAINNLPITPTKFEVFKELMKANATQIKDEHQYTAWYLFNMARTYPKALTTDAQRMFFVIETINATDCGPEAVLECFTAKMCAMKIPIYGEDFL